MLGNINHVRQPAGLLHDRWRGVDDEVSMMFQVGRF